MKKHSIKDFLAKDKDLSTLYNKIKTHTSPLVSSNYDVTDKCNLRCEGCLFFEGEDYKSHPGYKENTAPISIIDYQRFFQQEAEKGINFAYFAGGEPALEQERIKTGLEHIKRGSVATNGTIKINPDLKLSIHVSLWGDQEITKKVRGDSVYQKSIQNYHNDDRAIFIYTINHFNIDSIEKVTRDIIDRGSKISYNLFSPTTQYIGKLSQQTQNDQNYFRFSTQTENMCLTADDLKKTHDILQDMIEIDPTRVLYTPTFNNWVTSGESLYNIDTKSQVALDCPMHASSFHKTFRADLSQSEGKCCSPDIDCEGCRAYAMAYGTFKYRLKEFMGSYQDFKGWVETIDNWCRLYIYNWDKLK